MIDIYEKEIGALEKESRTTKKEIDNQEIDNQEIEKRLESIYNRIIKLDENINNIKDANKRKELQERLYSLISEFNNNFGQISEIIKIDERLKKNLESFLYDFREKYANMSHFVLSLNEPMDDKTKKEITTRCNLQIGNNHSQKIHWKGTTETTIINPEDEPQLTGMQKMKGTMNIKLGKFGNFSTYLENKGNKHEVGIGGGVKLPKGENFSLSYLLSSNKYKGEFKKDFKRDKRSITAILTATGNNIIPEINNLSTKIKAIYQFAHGNFSAVLNLGKILNGKKINPNLMITFTQHL